MNAFGLISQLIGIETLRLTGTNQQRETSLEVNTSSNNWGCEDSFSK